MMVTAAVAGDGEQQGDEKDERLPHGPPPGVRDLYKKDMPLSGNVNAGSACADYVLKYTLQRHNLLFCKGASFHRERYLWRE
jgi:hypothetical protein